MSTLIPFAGLSPVPWKNGGGSTTEIAIAPPDALFDEFEWRVSLATIAADGPFSQFPGVDRTLVLVEGHGVTLDFEDGERMLVCEDEPLAAFPGETRVDAKLNRGATTDFNVMTRRERCHHEFGRRVLAGTSTFAPRGDVTVLFLAQGDSLTVSNDAERIGMVRFDALVFDGDALWTLEAVQAEIFIVDIFYE
ncbi:HutD family protein [Massilia solisilvae]|uniref:HutD family protein n=1 Tax=Massilia solisilvae TaxID=1811225 RepID=A0ABT2BLL0_9BURK|nr:HutD family protein [Massilia solisilvae]MCS0609411.1 HutD family protein [Massilia solisilvae]